MNPDVSNDNNNIPTSSFGISRVDLIQSADNVLLLNEFSCFSPSVIIKKEKSPRSLGLPVVTNFNGCFNTPQSQEKKVSK